jgi:hypothetical protein
MQRVGRKGQATRHGQFRSGTRSAERCCVIDQVEHGHHVFRAYFKHAFLKQYEKFSTYLRNELYSNNLNHFDLKKGLDPLEVVRVGARE